MKRGGLLEELELRIQASNSIKNEYEKEIQQLEYWNSQLNYEYEVSYNIFFENKYLSPVDFEKLDEYRQCVIDKISINNGEISKLKEKLKKQETIHVLLTKCYYMINNCSLY